MGSETRASIVAGFVALALVAAGLIVNVSLDGALQLWLGGGLLVAGALAYAYHIALKQSEEQKALALLGSYPSRAS